MDIPYIPDGDPDELYDLLEEQQDAIGDLETEWENYDLDDYMFPW